MTTIDLAEGTFQEAVARPGTLLVDFWAAWCGPCRMFAPVFEQASMDYPDLVFAKVDTEAEQALSASLGIRSIPTLMIFRDGTLLYEQPGAIRGPALEQLIARVQEVDMDHVRTQLAARSTRA